MPVHHTQNPRLMGGRYAAASGNPQHGRQRQVAAPCDADIEQRLNDLVKPAVFAELDYYHRLGLRSRLLDLPVMVAIVLAMLWRQIPGVCALQRQLAHERILWAQLTRVSQPALSQRFLTFPAELFERVLLAVLERLPARWAARSRPVPPLLERVRTRFAACYAVDGTTLDALFRHLKALQELPEAPLAGHVVAVADLVTHLPAKVWYGEDPRSDDKVFLPQLLDWLPSNSLLVFDLGYFAFPFFDSLSATGSWFVTRLRQKTSYTIQQVLLDRPQVRDQIVHLGRYRSNPSTRPVRLIEVHVNGVWWRYLTNVQDPGRLSVLEVVALYQSRWHIETAFALVKGLLGLSYLWVGSINGVQLQVWATWLYYAVLLDLCDEVAEALQRPIDDISVEMVARSLYFYVLAVDQGYAGSAAKYFAENAKLLGIVKRDRTSKAVSVLTQVSLALDQDLTESRKT
jgi:Transposase DDE domain